MVLAVKKRFETWVTTELKVEGLCSWVWQIERFDKSRSVFIHDAPLLDVVGVIINGGRCRGGEDDCQNIAKWQHW